MYLQFSGERIKFTLDLNTLKNSRNGSCLPANKPNITKSRFKHRTQVFLNCLIGLSEFEALTTSAHSSVFNISPCTLNTFSKFD